MNEENTIDDDFEYEETYSSSVSYRMGTVTRKVTVEFRVFEEDRHNTLVEHFEQSDMNAITSDLYELVKSVKGAYVEQRGKKVNLSDQNAIDYAIRKNPHLRRAIAASYLQNIRDNMQVR